MDDNEQVHSTDHDAVVFRTPWFQRLWGWVTVAVGLLVVGVAIPAGLWAGVGFNVWRTLPWWWHGVGVVMAITGVTVILRMSRDSLSGRLALLPHGWRLDGVLRGSVMNYEQIALLRQESDRGSVGVGGMRKLIIELRAGGRRFIWLSKSDAPQCLEAMHALCGRVAALGPKGETIMPVEADAHTESHALLARHQRRRAWLLAIGAACLFAYSGFALFVLFSGTSSRSPASIAVRLVVLLGAAISLTVASTRRFRAADEHQRAATFLADSAVDSDHATLRQ